MAYNTSHFPGFEELCPFLRANYGLELAFIKALDGYEWLSWLVQDVSPSHEGHGSKYVLKIGQNEKNRDIATEARWRQAMMKHLADHGIVCPVVIPTIPGSLHCSYRAGTGVAYVIHMLTFVEGVPLQDRRANDPQTWFGVGQMLGHVRETLKTLNIPGLDKHQLSFQIERTGDFRKHLDLFEGAEERDILTKALDMFDEVLAPNLYIMERGAIHHDIHEGNIICLDSGTIQGMGKGGTDDCKAEAFSQFGVIDFGDMTMSCRMFDLSVFLGTHCKQNTPKKYVEFFKKLAHNRNSKTIDDKTTHEGEVYSNDNGEVEAGGLELTAQRNEASDDVSKMKEEGPCTTTDRSFGTRLLENTPPEGQLTHGDPSGNLDPTSLELDDVILSGHAIAGYLTTSSLTELEWEMLLASVCARLIVLLMDTRGNLPENEEELEKAACWEWTGITLLKRLVYLGKDRINAIWKGVCKDYGIIC